MGSVQSCNGSVDGRFADLTLRLPAGIVSCSGRDDRLLILGAGRAQPVVLSGAGAVIWEAVDGRSTVRQVVDHVASQFDVDAETIGEDCQQFLNHLVETQLLEVVS